VALVVLLDCTKVGVGGANVYDRGVAALDADRGEWSFRKSSTGSERSEAVISIQLSHNSHQVIQRPGC
jgi:hypothetical protein